MKPLPCGRADPTKQICRPRTQTRTLPKTRNLVFIVSFPCGDAYPAELFLSRLWAGAHKLRRDVAPITGAPALS
jgi:hypothetical protein